MNKIVFIVLILTFLAVEAAAQNSTENATARTVPEGFKSDGCSMFVNGDFRHCCVEHDLAYFKGGSISERLRADNKLYKCVANKNGWWHKLVAPVMWVGVRIGGVPFLPTKFRWGFGRKRQPRFSCKQKT